VSSVLKRLLSFFVLLTVSLHAQSVRWEPGSGTLAFNQTSQLSLVFEQCDVDGSLTLPEVPGLTISPQPNRAESNSFTVINGKASRSRTVTYTFRARPTERLNVTIPEFKIKTDKGDQTVSSAHFEIGDATVGQSSLSLDSIVHSSFTTPPKDVWAGEVFPLIYTLDAAKRYLYQLGSEPEWNSAPLTVEPWGKAEQFEATINNDPRVTIVYKARAYAKAPGSVTLNTATQLVNLATGTSGFTVFARPSLEQFSITSAPASFTVKPLPSPAPAGFTGAVGKFTLESQVVPATATVGEPITWTLTLDGTGNWPDIAGLPARSVSKDFRIVQPQAKRNNKNDSLFDASFSEDIVLIPTKPGTYTLPSVVFTIFNPATGAYENLSTKPVTLQVAPAASQSVAATTTPAQPGSPTPSATQPASVTPKPPAVLPRDPLAPSGNVSVPVSSRTLIVCLLSSILVPLSVWITLALRRARRTDPALILREAHTRLATTLHQLSADTQSSTLITQLIQSWQRDTAILWNLPQAVPTPAHIADPAWSTLWAEADRSLYGNAPLPADWTARASTALTACRVPAFSAFQLFLPRNLLPLIIVACSLIAVTSSIAADGRDSYTKADFPAAEKAWRDALVTQSTDWTAHHNLALTLIQENHPGEAAGHALAAFVQQPQNPSVRWHLAYAWKNAGVTPPGVAQLESPTAQLAALASSSRWQAVLIASGWLSALAIALGLQGAYVRRPRKLLTGILLAVSLVLATAAGISLRTYGPLSDARAVVVIAPTTLRSIPTDLDTQKSTPLSLGSVAIAEKTFLGWTRLSFPNGQTGWARTETLVHLW
jgi:hypothetical protein